MLGQFQAIKMKLLLNAFSPFINQIYFLSCPNLISFVKCCFSPPILGWLKKTPSLRITIRKKTTVKLIKKPYLLNGTHRNVFITF